MDLHLRGDIPLAVLVLLSWLNAALANCPPSMQFLTSCSATCAGCDLPQHVPLSNRVGDMLYFTPYVPGWYTMRAAEDSDCGTFYKYVTIETTCHDPLPDGSIVSPRQADLCTSPPIVGMLMTLTGNATLEGRIATDSEVTFCWCVVVRPPGSTAEVMSSGNRWATFRPDKAGGYWIRQTVTNGCSRSYRYLYFEAICNCAPVASFGALNFSSYSGFVAYSSTLLFNGVFSYDGETSNIFDMTYKWELASWSNQDQFRMVTEQLSGDRVRYTFLPAQASNVVTSIVKVSETTGSSSSLRELFGPHGSPVIGKYQDPASSNYVTLTTSVASTVVTERITSTWLGTSYLSHCTVVLHNATTGRTANGGKVEVYPYNRCLGVFRFRLVVSDGCSTSAAEASFDVSCRLPPSVSLQCSPLVNFDYVAGRFPPAIVDARSSSQGIFNYSWRVTLGGSLGTLHATTQGVVFVLPVAVDFLVRFVLVLVYNVPLCDR